MNYRAFDAANPFSLDRNTWGIPSAQSVNKDMTEGDRLQMVKLNRYLSRNNGLFVGINAAFIRYAIGPGLIPVHSDASFTNYFKRWAKAPTIDGQVTHAEVQRILGLQILEDGEGFQLKVEEDGQPLLQLIESQNFGGSEDGFTDGVKTNSYGRPISYRMTSGTVREAGGVIHSFDRIRPGQLRGIPMGAHAINDGLDGNDILKFEKQAQKLTAAIAAVFKTLKKDLLNVRSSPSVDSEGNVNRFSQITGVQTIAINPNESFDIPQSQRGGANFLGFLDYLTRRIATGYKVSPEFVWNSIGTGGAATRLILSQASAAFMDFRRLIEKACNAHWVYVIGTGIANGELTATADWMDVKWRGPALPSVDAGRDAKAEIESLRAGSTSPQRIADEQNEDWRKTYEENAIASAYVLELAAKYKVPAASIVSLNQNDMSASLGAPTTQNATP
jgi:capsid protein